MPDRAEEHELPLAEQKEPWNMALLARPSYRLTFLFDCT